MRAAALLALLIAATAAAYGPSLDGDWVYDDVRFVAANPAVETGVPLISYFSDPGTQAAHGTWEGLYRPLRTLSFRLVRMVSGAPSAQRVVNLLLHLTNGLLVWLVLRSLGPRSAFAAAAGAGVFLLHPAAVEATAWISSRGDLLALTFCLLAIFLDRRSGWAAAAASAAAFAMALSAKESAAFLPVALLVIGFVRGEIGRRWPRTVLHFGVLAAFLVARYGLLGPAEFGQGGGLGLGPLRLTAGLLSSWTYYAALVLFPWWLSFEVRLVWSALTVTAGFALLAGSVAAVLLLRRRSPGLALGTGIFLSALLPVTLLQYLVPLKIMVANRFAYPALLGAAVVAAVLAERGRRPAVLLAAVLCCLFALTAREAPGWRDEGRLWSAVVDRDPENPVALFGLGFDELRRGDPVRARDLLVRAARIDPGYPRLSVALGRACQRVAAGLPAGSPEQRRHLVEAQSAFHHAVRLWDAGAKDDRELLRFSLFHAGVLAFDLGREDIAREHLVSYLLSDGPGVGGVEAATKFLGLAEHFEGRGEAGLGAGLREAARTAGGGAR